MKSIKEIYDQHAVKLNNLKYNRAQQMDSLTDVELRMLDEQIELLASILSDIYRNILNPS